MSFNPSSYQLAIKSWFDSGIGNAAVDAVAGSGKCLGRGTPILLYSGQSVPVESVQVGDVLIGPDSKPRNVLSVNFGVGQLYQVQPTKGDPFVCNDAHILTLAGTNRFNGQTVDISVQDYLRMIEEKSSSKKDWKLFRTGVEWEEYVIPRYPAWIIGAWLGDGTVGEASWSFPDKELISEIYKFAEKLGGHISVFENDSKTCPTYRLSQNGERGQFRSFVRKECYRDSEKRIPFEYLYSSRENRLELMAGLIDTDGFQAGGYWEVVTRYPGLRDDILFLARSLGFAAYFSVKWVKLDGWQDARPYQRITISGELDSVPCRLERKRMPKREQIKRVGVTGFELIPIGEGEYFGFTLDGDGRFLLGDFTVTHNSTSIAWLLSGLSFALQRNSLITAFGVDIVKALGEKVPQSVNKKGINALGYAAIRKAFPQRTIQQWKVEAWKYKEMAKGLKIDSSYGDRTAFVASVVALLNFVQVTLTPIDDLEQIETLVYRFNLQIPPCGTAPLVEAVSLLLQEGVRMIEEDGNISFSDQVWYPNWKGLDYDQYQLICVDEAQDLSKAQMGIVQRSLAQDGRLISVGDPKQAIYMFNGAECDAFDQLVDHFSAERLPLSICYRCPSEVVKEAQRIVPQIEAREDAPTGVVDEIKAGQFRKMIAPGDMVLSRTTAPLVKLCFEMIAARQPATIKGRDISAGLTSVVEQVSKKVKFHDFDLGLDEYENHQVALLERKPGTEASIENLRDKCETIRQCYRSFAPNSARGFISDIESLFSDVNGNRREMIVFSTVHRSKGLENPRVFIVYPEKLPLVWKNQSEAQFQQERNLEYVAITRAQAELYYVETDKEGV